MPERIGQIDDEGYSEVQGQLLTLARLVRTIPLAQFLARIQTAHAVGPILDPTAYHQAIDKLSDVEALARSLVPFQTEIARQLGAHTGGVR